MNKVILVSGPVIVEDNKVLLNNHGDKQLWKFCGGKVEVNDASLIHTAQREAKEEMGIDIDILDDNPFIMYSRQDEQDIILVHYLAKRLEDIYPDVDIRNWSWFDINHLPDNLAPNIIPTLKHFKFIK